MSFVKQDITTPNLKEEFLYHASESKYHLEQYLNAFEEAERHYEKYKEHSMCRDEMQTKLWESRHANA